VSPVLTPSQNQSPRGLKRYPLQHDGPSPETGRAAKIALFGHFGRGNFGNESTLQAVLCNLRRLMPDTEISCICTGHEIVREEYKIPTVPVSSAVIEGWRWRNPLARLLRKLLIGIPSELYRWLRGIATLREADMLIVVGTGLLTDAFGLGAWGPYNVFKWSVIARLCRCRLMFVSVGAGPLETRRGRIFVKSALALANFRSYRDQASQDYLKGIGFGRRGDSVCPDLAFSLPAFSHERSIARRNRPVVGLGLMEHGGMYGVERTTEEHYAAYMETMVAIVEWLLERQYDVRLIIGALNDVDAVRDFQQLLKTRLGDYDRTRVVAEPIHSAEDLLEQLDATDFVVATRFHNVLLALFLNKPSIAISFHHKCSSLMKQMGLSEYYQEINSLDPDRLIEQFCDLERNATTLKAEIRRKADECRTALDEQYKTILSALNA